MVFHLNRSRFSPVRSALLMAGMLAAESWLATASFANSIAPIDPIEIAQTGTLTERPDQIDGCRGTGTTTLTVHANSALSRPIGTVPANARVTLTGVFGSGVVQIKAPIVGWVAAATLKTDCGSEGGLPPDIDTNPRYCRRLRNSRIDGAAFADLDNGLVAHSSPDGARQVTSTGAFDGPAGGAIVRVTAVSPEVVDRGGKRWIRIKYNGIEQSGRIGWVSNGPTGTNRNLANCVN